VSDCPHVSGRVSVAIRTLGCKVNRVESESILADLLGTGAVLADEDCAAVIVINTCTVTGEADAKARKAVRHALASANSPVVVVTGCLASLDAPALRSLSPRVIVEPDKGRVAEAVGEALGVTDRWNRAPRTEVAPWGEGFRARAMLKVQDGCDSFCAYCIVPHARGVPRSVPLRQIAERSGELASAGAREIVLSGINVGRYRDGSADLADVVAAVAATGVARVRLSSIEPQHLSARLLEVLGSTPAVCAHLHVPLQSGSNRVLGLMGRSYTTDQYARGIAEARTALAGLSVTTDLIAGFPTETDADHADGLEFVQAMGFAKMHVFRYSERSGTPAAREPQVAPQVRARRAAELRALGETMRRDYLASRSGETAELLVETVADGMATGTTREYIRASLAAEELAVGEIVEVLLGEALAEPLPASRMPEAVRG
jgi:threonylcarbamoyladenosine tRNA methylthiotransferase MtaB